MTALPAIQCTNQTENLPSHGLTQGIQQILGFILKQAIHDLVMPKVPVGLATDLKHCMHVLTSFSISVYNICVRKKTKTSYDPRKTTSLLHSTVCSTLNSTKNRHISCS